MPQILAFSGRKQSGKNTLANYIFGKMLTLITTPGGDPIVSHFKITRKGKLVVPAELEPRAVYNYPTDEWQETNDGKSEGIFDPLSKDASVVSVLYHNVWPHIKIYHFADALKDVVCVGLLGLDPKLIWGSDEDKNQLTHLRWEDMPLPRSVAKKLKGQAKKEVYDFLDKKGQMSIREVMQFVGTEVFRAMYSPVWINACLNRIKTDNPDIALIADLRFPEEATAVQTANGKIIRLRRNEDVEEEHESETALDGYDKFDAFLDNSSLSHHESFEQLTKILADLKIGLEE